MVSGVAGIGTTRLLAAAATAASSRGFLVREAVAGEFERDLAWGVVRDLFAFAVRRGTRTDRDLFAGAAALAMPVLGLAPARPGAEALSSALHGLYWLTANLSDRTPVYLSVDDAPWADAASARHLRYLAGRLLDLPVVLAVAIRITEPEAPDHEAMFQSVPGVTLLEPAPLSPEAGQRMRAR